MKKMLAMFLVTTLSLSMLAGCGSNSDAEKNASAQNKPSTVNTGDNNKKDTPPADKTDKEDSSKENTDTPEGGIRENGKLPEDVKELTAEEYAHYTNSFMTAFKELDMDALSSYITDETDLEKLTIIHDDANAVAFWKKVVGAMEFFPDSNLLIAKSTDYIYGNWYTQAWKDNKELPDSTAALTPEEVTALYDQYFEAAPYVCGFPRKAFYVEDGYFHAALDDCLESVAYERPHDLLDYNDCLQYGALLMGKQDSLGLGYEYIAEDIPAYQKLYEKDLDTLVSELEAALPDSKKNGSFYERYQNYYVPAENRAILQQYFNENIECYLQLGNLCYLDKADVDIDFPMSSGTEETRSRLKNYNIVNRRILLKFPENFNNNFSFFCDIADKLVEKGMLPK